MSAPEFFFIGAPELVTGFRFAGVGGEVALTRNEVLSAFRSVQEGSVRVVVLSREAADLVREELTAWQQGGRYPLVVEVPPLEGGGLPSPSLLEMIREAVGLPV